MSGLLATLKLSISRECLPLRDLDLRTICQYVVAFVYSWCGEVQLAETTFLTLPDHTIDAHGTAYRTGTLMRRNIVWPPL
jgi:hypothetical protein